MPGEDQKPARPDIMGGRNGMQGIGSGNLPDVVSLHRHSGQGPADGGQLQGPYYIADMVNGHLYQIVCKGGTLSAKLIR